MNRFLARIIGIFTRPPARRRTRVSGKEAIKRNREIKRRREAGEEIASIAASFGLSQARVLNITAERVSVRKVARDRAIKRQFATGRVSEAQLAAQFNLSERTIKNIVAGMKPPKAIDDAAGAGPGVPGSPAVGPLFHAQPTDAAE